MLNEEKIRWMTKASIYEKRQGRIDLGRNEYFMGDYVRLHLLKNGISLIIAYILLAGLYAVYKIEEIFDMAANMQLGLLLKEMLLLYIILLVIYTGIGIVYYSWQYQSSRKQVKKYYRNYSTHDEIIGAHRSFGNCCDAYFISDVSEVCTGAECGSSGSACFDAV